ncbi:hypothetical protein KGA66_12870 [Actinocrinis puniceicyclus]|uniref:IrrE N-terminal-like domain-containing protein n=1 Tax=Actinocrinis puniceicyclus TaxID=977794 RepID=A0A8J7WKF8_9ACTN|nr:hypothetical protein [Actinocrinis puniceicyclus]MBS2963941.1 hypothetical protein [Actinocrinis puniceicyclus]
MNGDRSRRECEALVAGLDLPEPFDLAELCRRLGEQRGRSIVLMSHDMVIGGLCGTWMGTATADYVFYEQDTSRLHQQHIVCHEIGHILRRHEPGKVLSSDLARLIAPTVERSDVRRVLGRDCYDDHEEFEAEFIATLILRRVGRLPLRESPTATDPAASDVIARISQSLSRGQR